MVYLALLTREGKHHLVSFPDCPGCQTFGPTRADALAMAADALQGWLEAHLAAGDAPPKPSARRKARTRSTLAPITVPVVLAVRLQLRWARQELGLTQAELAKRVGVSRQQIALLESPDANVTLKTLERVAHAMDLRLEIQLQPVRQAA